MWTGRSLESADCPLSACREQRLDDCSLQTGPRFCLTENAFPVRRISGVFRSVLGFHSTMTSSLSENAFPVRRQRGIPSRLRISDCVRSFVERGLLPQHERACLGKANPGGWCLAGPNGATTHDHLAMGATKNLKLPKAANCFVCT